MSSPFLRDVLVLLLLLPRRCKQRLAVEQQTQRMQRGHADQRCRPVAQALADRGVQHPARNDDLGAAPTHLHEHGVRGRAPQSTQHFDLVTVKRMIAIVYRRQLR